MEGSVAKVTDKDLCLVCHACEVVCPEGAIEVVEEILDGRDLLPALRTELPREAGEVGECAAQSYAPRRAGSPQPLPAGYTHGSSQTRIDFKYKKVTTSYQPLPPPNSSPPQDEPS